MRSPIEGTHRRSRSAAGASLLAMIAGMTLLGCHNKEMMGAATQVTGGRVFKTTGMLGLYSIEQQMLFDLQGLSLEPGDVMRNGGFGEPGGMFTLKYGDDSREVCLDYPFGYDPGGASTDSSTQPFTGEQFVSRVGTLLQKVDRLAGTLADAEIRYHRDLSDESNAGNDLAAFVSQMGDVDSLPRKTRDELIEIVSKVAVDNTPSSTENRPVAPSRATASLMQVQQARVALQDAQSELEDLLARGRNYVIFRWSAEDRKSADGSVSERLRVLGSRERIDSGFAVAAGVRRRRLVIGPDLTPYYAKIDPRNALVAPLEDRWSATGLVTEMIQVEHIQYFTKGGFQAVFQLIASASPAELSGMLTPESLASLKLSLGITASQLTSYENRALLTTNSRSSVAWPPAPPGSAAADGWTTIAAAATSLRYLEKTGRLDRRRARKLAEETQAQGGQERAADQSAGEPERLAEESK